MNEEKMIAFGDFVVNLVNVTAQIACTIQKSQEIIRTSDNEEEIAKAERNYVVAKKAKEGIKHYSALKSSPTYKPIFEHYGVDKLNESLERLCRL